MAKVHFAPNCAIKYVGSKAKVFNTSVARPKPTLKKGDIIIVDKKTAFNLVTKGFGEFVNVDEISYTKADTKVEVELQDLRDELDAYKNENNALFMKNVELTKLLAEDKE
ncbi:MAG: hypothetical protein Q9M40_07065 [Sulfurimonas sp.]|nr:hypothetical protein [Sulfurimonas sp.]MDQ7067734.1 hypothetical protein [Sulfurimonas sp.]